MPEQGKALGAAWRALGGAARAPFEADATQRKADYETAKAAWTAAGGAPVVRKSPKKSVTPKPKRPPSAYALFFKATKPTLSGDFGAASKEISKRWGAMSDAEKAKYTEEAAALKAKAAA